MPSGVYIRTEEHKKRLRKTHKKRTLSTLEEKFFRKVIKNNGCWGWKGVLYSTGYAYLSERGVRIGAHRLSYQIYKGEIPKDLFVLHSCDNPSCVNPEHLRVGTSKENMRDKVQRNRCNNPTGEKHGNAKLTWIKVKEIRRLYISGKYSKQGLGRIFNVSEACIRSIINRLTWIK